MSLTQFVRRLEDGACEFGKRLVPAAVRAWWTDEEGRLKAALDQHDASAHRCSDESRHARARIAENEVRAAILESHVETFIHSGEQARAYHLALELEQVRHELTEDRCRLSRLEKASKVHRDRIAELDRRLTDLQRQLHPWTTA